MSSLISDLLHGPWVPVVRAATVALGLHLAPAPERSASPPENPPPRVRLIGQAAADTRAEQALQEVEESVERIERNLEGVERQVAEAERGARRRQGGPRRGEGEAVKIGSSFNLPEGDRVDEVVVVLGDATIDGEVSGNVVVVGGSARIRGRVGGDVINVGGGVELGPDADVEGEVVGVGGGVQEQDGARVGGEIVRIQLADFKGFHVPQGVHRFFRECVLKLRPLALDVGWVWPVWATLFLIHIVIAALFPRGTLGCSEIIRTRPAAAFGTGALMYPLVLIVAVLLLATGVGVLILPFLALGLKFAGIVGRNGVMHHLGAQFLRRGSAGGADSRILPPLLLGGLLVALLYLVPFVGLLTWLTLGTWGLGAATLAILGRERSGGRAEPIGADPIRPAAFVRPVDDDSGSASTPGSAIAFAGAPAAAAAGEPAGATARGAAPDDSGFRAGSGTEEPPRPPRPDPLTLERVGLGHRLGAAAIDLALLFVVLRLVSYDADWLRNCLTLAYFVGLWVARGTTVGGLILRIRVVRLDGRPLDFPTALVRSLGAVLSVAILGIGYFWCAWDPEKQTWHDKLAGTAVVRDPALKSLL